MHNLVPRFILQQHAAGEHNGRFPAAALFIDISGFSTITDTLMQQGQHGAEVLADVMRTVFVPLVHAVYAHGGLITNFAGDAFTALFPATATGLQDVALSALTAAWETQQAMAQHAQRATPYGTFTLSAKVGVAAGEAAWGIATAENGQRASYYFQGSAVEDCAAAEHRAQAGEIVLTAAVQAQVTSHITAQPVDDHFRVTAVHGPLPPPQPIDRPAADLDLMAHFFPRTLLTEALSGEFRQVVNLFISLPTIRTETQLNLFMQTLFTLQDRYGGLLNRLDFGDKGANLLLFWGAPVAYENDIQRALNFILDLQIRSSIPVTAGVTYRIAHAGFIGSALREEYTCYGRGVNLAARFMTTAPRREIWLDEHIARHAEQAFDVEYEGEMAFKGFTKKQKVYVLLERKEEQETFYSGRLVGRETETAQLQAFIAPLWQGRYAGITVVWGEPGIGKSRLVHEFLRQLPGEAQTFLAQTDEILRESLNPFRYWLRHYFKISESQSEARNKRNFNRRLDNLVAATEEAELAAELDRTRSFLGALVDLHWPDSLYEQVDAQVRYENTLIGVVTLLQAESWQRPVILHLEDAHWLDSDSRALLLRLARTLAASTAAATVGYPLAIIATARREGESPLLGDELPYAEIDLQQLTESSLARLAEQHLGGPPAPTLQRLLAERAEGNPFFVEQIARYLQERDLLQVSAEGVVGPRPNVALHDATVLPLDVRAVLVARLDRLAREVREVVQTASVLGREFELQLLMRMLRGQEQVMEHVAAAERAAIWMALSQLGYLFRHALLRDAAYRMQLRARRKMLHALVVDALENLYGADLAPHFGELAYHAEQAGLTEQALRYLRLAGDAARDAYQNSQAVDYYSRALALANAEAATTRFHLLLGREAVYNWLGQRDAQQQDLEALAQLAGQIDDQAQHFELALRRATFASTTGNYETAVTAVRRAVELAVTLHDQEAEAKAYHRWGRIHWQAGQSKEALPHLAHALALARHSQTQPIAAQSLYDLGVVAHYQHRYREALDYLRQAQAVYDALQDKQGEVRCRNLHGLILWNLGDYTEALDQYEHALALCREVGWRYAEASILLNMGGLLADLGAYAQSRDYHLRARRACLETGNKENEAMCLDTLGLISSFQGEPDAARQLYEEALDVERGINNQRVRGYILTHLGYALAQLGDYAAARTVLAQALAIREQQGIDGAVMDTAAGVALLAWSAGALAEARDRVAEIVTWVDANGADSLEYPLQVYLICYNVLQTAADDHPPQQDEAQRLLTAAHTLLEEKAARIQDPDLRRHFLESVPFNHALRTAWQQAGRNGEGTVNARPESDNQSPVP